MGKATQARTTPIIHFSSLMSRFPSPQSVDPPTDIAPKYAVLGWAGQ